MLFNYEGYSKLSGIYEIINRISGKRYIGSAKEFKERWKDHVYSLRKNKHQNKHLQYSFNKHFEELGNDNFLEFNIIEILENSTKEERLNREEFWINFAKNENINLFNSNLKPTKEPKIIPIPSDEIKAKHSLNAKTNQNCIASQFKTGQSFEEKFGIEKANEIKQAIRDSHLNKKMKESTKKKISIANKENNYLKNKTFEEVFGSEKALQLKQRISETSKSRPSNRLGKKHSDKSIEKMKQIKIGKFIGLKNPNVKIYDLSKNPLISPTNEIFIKIECLNEFCRQHQLAPSSLCCLLNGKIKKHKGWSLRSNTELFKNMNITDISHTNISIDKTQTIEKIGV